MSYIQQFCDELIKHSDYKEYDGAILEWLHKGDRWVEDKITFCICGHPIKERCLVINEVNGNRLIIGNCCIHKFGIKREHWNKSRKNYLEYALSQVKSTSDKGFITLLLDQLSKYPNLRMTEKNKERLVSIAGKPYRFTYKWKYSIYWEEE